MTKKRFPKNDGLDNKKKQTSTLSIQYKYDNVKKKTKRGHEKNSMNSLSCYVYILITLIIKSNYCRTKGSVFYRNIDKKLEGSGLPSVKLHTIPYPLH